MNIQIDNSNKILILNNFMDRMAERKNYGYVMHGIITQAERNALHSAIKSLKKETANLKLGGDENVLD